MGSWQKFIHTPKPKNIYLKDTPRTSNAAFAKCVENHVRAILLISSCVAIPPARSVAASSPTTTKTIHTRCTLFHTWREMCRLQHIYSASYISYSRLGCWLVTGQRDPRLCIVYPVFVVSCRGARARRLDNTDILRVFRLCVYIRDMQSLSDGMGGTDPRRHNKHTRVIRKTTERWCVTFSLRQTTTFTHWLNFHANTHTHSLERLCWKRFSSVFRFVQHIASSTLMTTRTESHDSHTRLVMVVVQAV